MQTYALLLAFAVVVVMYLVVYHTRKRLRESESADHPAEETQQSQVDEEPEECCGQHAVCEKTSLRNTSLKVEYYDDEELDDLAGRSAADYSDQDVERLSEVFHTLQDYDVAGWLRSLQLRNIELPDQLREEALLIVEDVRSRMDEK